MKTLKLSLEWQLIIIFTIFNVVLLVMDCLSISVKITGAVLMNLGVAAGALLPILIVSWLIFLVIFAGTTGIIVLSATLDWKLTLMLTIVFPIAALVAISIKRKVLLRGYALRN